MAITVSDLTAKLPAGITLDTDYPNSSPALLPIVDILEAFAAAQADQNAANTTVGLDVNSLTKGIGTEQFIFYPPNQTTATVLARETVYSVRTFQKVAVSDVFEAYV